ncbi:hypothetical protein [Piscinibacter sp. HJYY11]|uniref:hypothetical protein n=1 Tax=Piscinibacter sp. HJYY11 TaxID=2801333 RepID=UPI00191EB796|nr:hypothetical protein [Piscinibacter sp. HJYY11]MBL0729656.1 hypothetical protein [Piscinibacter sp. HJYY11]
MNRLSAYGAFAALLCYAHLANGQLLKYESEAEVHGAAAVSPETIRQILKKLQTACAPYQDPNRLTLEVAVAEWELRHRDFLKENERIKQEFLDVANDSTTTPETKRKLLYIFEVIAPTAVEVQSNALISPLTLLPDAKSKISICSSYAIAISEGKFNLERNDPVVAKYLKQRIADNTDKTLGKTTSGLSIAPDLAAADKELIGCWQAQRVVRLLSDGRKATNDTNYCTMSIQDAQIRTRCTGPGPGAVIEYSYKITKPGVYQATMTSNSGTQQGIGTTREYIYRIDGDSLHIETYLQAAQPPVATLAVKVESVSRKVPCQDK